MRHINSIVSVVLGVAAGCRGHANLQCEQSANCDLAGGGMCSDPGTGNHWCAYPDGSCPSGYRYSDIQVGDGVSGQCVSGGGTNIDGGTDSAADASSDGATSDADADPILICKSAVVFADAVYRAPSESFDAFEVWISNLDGTQMINLSNSPAQDLDPDWSPSGTRIAFASSRNGSDSQFDIYVVNADGTNLTNLTPGSQASGYNNTHPVWSPDGTRIAFLRNYVVWVMNANGTGAAPVSQYNSLYMAWSPNGTQLVFDDYNIAANTYNGLYVATVGDGSPRKLTSRTGGEFGAEWSPASRILFSYQFDIFSINPDGSDLISVTTDGRFNSDPQTINDMSVIAFDRADEIWVKNMGEDKQLTHNTQGQGERYFASDISGDARHVAFKHRKLVDTNADGSAWEIGIIDLDGGNLHVFNAPGSQSATQPKLAPCSRAMARTWLANGSN